MFLDPYYREEAGLVRIELEQASCFAKQIAGDFNPIHDADARRFCVPGDLLFALAVVRYGLYEQMGLQFHSMVGRATPLIFSESDGASSSIIDVKDEKGKRYLEVTCKGERTTELQLIEPFIRRYVAFSGLNFPHYLKPLLEEEGVMFNPERPLVVYDHMEYKLRTVADAAADLVFARSALQVEGRRAAALLEFEWRGSNGSVGSGKKKLLLSGLRPYDADAINAMIKRLEAAKAAHQSEQQAEGGDSGQQQHQALEPLLRDDR